MITPVEVSTLKIRKYFTLIEMVVVLCVIALMVSTIESQGESLLAGSSIDAVTMKFVSLIRDTRYQAMRYGGYGAISFFDDNNNIDIDRSTQPSVSMDSQFSFSRWILLPPDIEPESFKAQNPAGGGWNYFTPTVESIDWSFEKGGFSFTGFDNVDEATYVGKHRNNGTNVSYTIVFDSKGYLSPGGIYGDPWLAKAASFQISDGDRIRTISIHPNGSVVVTKS